MRKNLIGLLLLCATLQADEVTFRERFADPATRTAALAELIPGSREAYFHTALDHQLAGREAEFVRTMAEWKAASERKENPVSSRGLTVLENRQLLMDYQKSPVQSLDGLIRKLDLHFDDERPDAAAAAGSLPTRVDPELLSEAAFEKVAAREFPDQPYTGYSGERRLRELERVEEFDEAKIRWFLENLDRADLPGVVPLIDRAMNLKKPVNFGDLPLREKLTSSQLATLLELHPDLRANLGFVLQYLAKLRPGAEVDFERDPQAHAAHLGRCRDIAMTLPPALNSLKAHVLFHHLRMQADLENLPKEDFLTFLALPRTRHPLLKISDVPDLTRIQLEADFAAATACPPVRDDLKLIQSHLQHFLGATDSAADFAPFIEARELALLHARARLLAGADPARWGPAIDPAEYQSLQQESRIGFAPGAPVLLDADAAVSLKLDLKNTPDVLIRVYELDLPAQLARSGSEPEVSIDLDGLVPHHERRLTFPQAPILLHRETIGLPELDGAGAWLVDFVGGQVSARVLVRKGQLIPYVERTATSQVVRVFDEKGNPVRNATARLGREILTADAAGRITIPNAPNDPLTRGIVQAGKLAVPLNLEPRSDQLAMDARFHLDREQLLADQEARLHLRVRLTNHGYELPLDRIKEPALVLKAELLGGVTTERVIAEDLKLAPVVEVPFQVPADLLKLTLTLRGTVTPATGGDPVKLSREATYDINGDLKMARVGTAFFSPAAEGHRLEVRGRNGEPLASRAITMTCSHFDYHRESIKLEVRTDASGRVDLGRLEGIASLTAEGTDIGSATYYPTKPLMGEIALQEHSQDLHLPANSEIRFPLDKPAATADRLRISLLEFIGITPIRDHFDKISIDGGELVIRNLPPGDFKLSQGSNTQNILVSSGMEKDGLLISRTRILPHRSPTHPSVASAKLENDRIVIQLRGHGSNTRVSLVGRRYYHKQTAADLSIFPFPPALPEILIPGFTGTEYLTDRRLSDEMRYILDRRATKAFPGSMLPRPGMLLNRWTRDDLTQESRSGQGGGPGISSGRSRRENESIDEVNNQPFSSAGGPSAIVCDFLQFPSVVRFDLTPEADGSLKLPLAEFEGSQFIEIFATDAFAYDTHLLPLPASETPLRDRRIARPLDPQAHFLATRSDAVLQKDAEASIENLLDADWRAFTTLSEAQEFLYGMSGDDRLREFAFLPDWPDFTEKKKLELLSTHACHEFHLFLARKDKAFFEKHVKPLLAQKPEPTFIDEFLLGRDLKPNLRPYAWQRLNAAEKALLSQALPEARERISRELSLRWQLEAPAPDAETKLFTQTLRGSDLALQDSLGLARQETNSSGGELTEGASSISEKLRRIVIPRIDFEDTTVEEAIDFLRLRSAELDTTELDPSKKGLSFMIQRPRGNGGQDDPGALRIKDLRIRNIPLATALKYICDGTKLRYKVDDFAVTLVPQTEAGEEIFTRTYDVPPDFSSSLDSGDSGGAGSDPFAYAGSSSSAKLSARPPIAELLKRAGIHLPEGSSATLSSTGKLIVTATPGELDKVDQLTQTLGCSKPIPGVQETANGFADSQESDPFADLLPELPNSVGSSSFPMTPATPGDPFAEPASGGAAKLEARQPHLTFPDRTRLWREANYYKNIEPTDESLIPLNRFWLDLAAWDGRGAFLSPHFNACHTTANEALMCLALLDLPFKAERPEVKVDGSTLRVKAREPMLLFYKDTRRTEMVAAESPLLVRQTFSPLAEPFRTVNGQQVENPVTGDFRPGVPYRESLVVTNPTGIGRRIDVLAQIPAGAIPLGGKLATLSSTHELAPYGVVMLELAFYFPAVGDFPVYPLQVSEDGTILADTKSRTLRVSNDPEPVDEASWGVLANEGSSDEVLERLRTENLKTLDLSAICWRLKDAAFFLDATRILRDRLFFSPAVAAYGFRHNDVATIREYLENSAAVRQLGDWLDSPLLEVRPRVHHEWETLEFDPLVNARAHRFANESRLTHEAAREHYQAFLDQLGWKPSLDAADQLTLAAFLFLQDRIEEGLARFDRIDPEKLPGRVNYDYLRAVVLFHREKAEEAKAIALQLLPTLPPGLWRDRFQAVVDQADEVAGLDRLVDNAKPEQEIPAPQIDLTFAADGKLVIRHRSLEKAKLRLYGVDLEVLFSKDPFLQGDGSGGGEPAIRPNADLEVPLAGNAAETAVELPEGMWKGNLLVSAESGTKKLLKVLDSRALELRHTAVSRTVQVFDASSSKPLPKTYVKVYAEMNSGEMVFHKDGYTDLRGKFDYLSNTAVDASTVKRVAILFTHPEKGARTVIYDR